MVTDDLTAADLVAHSRTMARTSASPPGRVVLVREFCVMDHNEDQLTNLATVTLSIITIAGIVAMLVYFDMP
jgi:hypothetical protein